MSRTAARWPLCRLLLLVFLLALAGSAAHAALIKVPTEYSTIQAAVNAAAAGDTVLVTAGRYSENVTIDKALEIWGANDALGADDPRREAESILAPPAGARGLTIACNCRVVVRGFTFEANGAAAIGTPLNVTPELVLLNNRFRRAAGARGSGLVLHNATRFEARHNRFRDLRGDTAALHLSACLNLRFFFNRIDSVAGVGMRVDGLPAPTADSIAYNTFANTDSAGLILTTASGQIHNLVIESNDFRLCNRLRLREGGGIYAQPDGGFGFREIAIRFNRFTDGYNGLAFQTGRPVAADQWTVRYNSFAPQAGFGVYFATAGTFEATGNHWNSPAGPTVSGNDTPGRGTALYALNPQAVAYSPWLSLFTDASADTAGLQLRQPATFWARRTWFRDNALQRAVDIARPEDRIRVSDVEFQNQAVLVNKNILIFTENENGTPQLRRLTLEGPAEQVELRLEGRFRCDSVVLTRGTGGRIQTGRLPLEIVSHLSEDAGRAVYGRAEVNRVLGTTGSDFAGIGLSLSPGPDFLGRVRVLREAGQTGLRDIEGSTSIARTWTVEADGARPARKREITLSWYSDGDNGLNLGQAQLWTRLGVGIGWSSVGPVRDLRPATEPRVLRDSISDLGEFTVARPNVCQSLRVAFFPPRVVRCQGDDPVTLLARASGGNGTLSYEWSPPDELNTTTGALVLSDATQLRDYTVTVRDDSGCVATATVQVIPALRPTIQTLPTQRICRGDSLRLSAIGGVAYTWVPDSTLLGTDRPDPLVRPSQTTTYTVIGRTDFECTNSATTEVVVLPVPEVEALAVTPELCFGASTRLEARADLPNVTFRWSPNTGLTNPLIATPIAQPLETTTYTVTGTRDGCSATAAVRVQVRALPRASGGADRILCRGERVQLFATGGVRYQWRPLANIINPDSVNPIVDPVATTRYFVTAIDSFGCSNTASVFVTVVSNPVARATGDTLICRGDSARLRATGGTTFRWTPDLAISNLGAANPLVSPHQTTTYTVEVRDANGCRSRDSIRVRVRPLPELQIEGANALCVDDSTVLRVVSPSVLVDYRWTPDVNITDTRSPEPVVFPRGTINYSVTVRDELGCTARAEHLVDVKRRPLLSVGESRTICRGNRTQLFATGAAYYSWSPREGILSDPNIPNPTVRPDTTTTYTVTGTDLQGCSSRATVRVNLLFPDPVVLEPGDFVSLCPRSQVTLQAPIENGFRYQWFKNDAPIRNALSPSLLVRELGLYSVEIITIQGCTLRSAVTRVVEQPAPAADAGPTVFTCRGSGGQRLRGSGGAIYRWEPTEGLSANDTPTPLANPLRTTTYTLTVTDLAGCTARDTVTVVVNDPPSVVLQADGPITICEGESTVLRATASAGSFLQWFFNDMELSDRTTSVLDVDRMGRYTVRATRPGCPPVESAPIFISVLPTPQVEALPLAFLCLSSPGVPLTARVSGGAEGGYQFRWQPERGLSSATVLEPVARPDFTTTYTLTATDRRGCRGRAVVRVEVRTTLPPPPIRPAGPLAFCAGESRELSTDSVPGYTYEWRREGQLIARSRSRITIERGGLYYVMVSSPGCEPARSIGKVVQVNPLPRLRVEVQPASCATCDDGQFTAQASPDGTDRRYVYSIDNKIFVAANTFIRLLPGTYRLRTRDVLGCADSLDVVVGVATGRRSAQSRAQLSLYPNPTTGPLELRFELPSGIRELTLSLYDGQGRLVWSEPRKGLAAGPQHWTLELPAGLAAGLYQLRLAGTDFEAGHKLLLGR